MWTAAGQSTTWNLSLRRCTDIDWKEMMSICTRPFSILIKTIVGMYYEYVIPLFVLVLMYICSCFCYSANAILAVSLQEMNWNRPWRMKELVMMQQSKK